MANPQSFTAHCAVVANDLGVETDEVKTAMKLFAQKKVDAALTVYHDGVVDSAVNGAPAPVSNGVSERLEYMALFD